MNVYVSKGLPQKAMVAAPVAMTMTSTVQCVATRMAIGTTRWQASEKNALGPCAKEKGGYQIPCEVQAP